MFYSARMWHAIQKAASTGQDEQPVIGEWLKLVFWKPYEGIIITKDRQPIFVSPDRKGGKKLVRVYRGERVEARVPLGTEKMRWSDKDKTLTKEGIRVKADVAIEWTISDLESYVYKINRPDRIEGMGYYEYLKATTHNWINLSVEGIIRKNIRLLTIGELISSSSSFLNHEVSGTTTVNIDSVSRLLQKELQKDLGRFGIEVLSLDILDIQFDKRIQKAIDSLKEAYLVFKRSEFEGRSAIARLRPMIYELGKDAIVLIESLKANNGTLFLNSNSFFDRLLNNTGDNRNISKGGEDDHPLLRK